MVMNFLRRLFAPSRKRVVVWPTHQVITKPVTAVQSAAIPRQPLDTRTATLKAEQENSQLKRPVVFEPALIPKHARRAGEPGFESSEDAAQWYSLRTRVLHHILSTITALPAGQDLILRGSAVLSAWYPHFARRPGDLDWVFTPAMWRSQPRKAETHLERIIDALRGSQVFQGVTIPDRPFAVEEIWGYDRCPGRRVIVPWEAAEPRWNGTVQLDFVIGEEMPGLPTTTLIAWDDLPPISLQTASPEQSLAWKLLWLSTDNYASGKDLYDAVLLAESTALSADLLRQTFFHIAPSWSNLRHIFNDEMLSCLSVNWDEFILEYPHIEGTMDDWRQRLIVALGPLFEELAAKPA